MVVWPDDAAGEALGGADQDAVEVSEQLPCACAVRIGDFRCQVHGGAAAVRRSHKRMAFREFESGEAAQRLEPEEKATPDAEWVFAEHGDSADSRLSEYFPGLNDDLFRVAVRLDVVWADDLG